MTDLAADYTVAPVVDDVDTGGFFAAAGDGRLAVQHCGHCGAVLHLPRAYCRFCGKFEPEWRTVQPNGTVYSFTVVTHQVHPAFPVPYTVLVIELDEPAGVRLIAHLSGRPDVRIGQPVRAEFIPLGPDAALPNWRLVEPGRAAS
jgi:uncharacterized OB-fold protein